VSSPEQVRRDRLRARRAQLELEVVIELAIIDVLAGVVRSVDLAGVVRSVDRSVTCSSTCSVERTTRGCVWRRGQIPLV
jgi:hypothetical protein